MDNIHMFSVREGVLSVDVRRRFDEEMMEIYYKSKERTGYNAVRYYSMLQNGDSIQVAKKLIRAIPPCDGFTNLIYEGQCELTVEALALKAEYQQFFTDEELKLCRVKLGIMEN